MTSVAVARPFAERSHRAHHRHPHHRGQKLAELHKRREESLLASVRIAVEKVHAKNKLTARERIYALLGRELLVGWTR